MTIWKGGGRDDDLFDTIYRKYYARVWRYFCFCRVSDDEAHDLSQDVFKRFYEHMPQFRGDQTAIWAFLQKTARNILLNRIRSNKTLKRNAVTMDIDDPELPFEIAAREEPDYAEREERALRTARIRKAITGLSEGQRQVVLLWIQDLTYAQIASTLGISVDAVKSRLRDAKKHLQEQLGEDQ